MKKKLFVIFFIISINSYGVFSQTILSGNLYFENPYFINPAYAGSTGFLSANLNYRQTSASIEGSPTLIGFGIHSPVYKSMSLGGRFFKQSEGLFDNISCFIDYSYRLKLKNKQFLSFGFSTGLKSDRLNYSEIIAEDPNAIIDVASRNFEGVYFQSAAGFVYNWDKLEFSFSLPQLYESKKTFGPDYCTFLAYKFGKEQQNLSVKPSILLTYNPNKPVQYDVNFMAYWKDLFFLGVAYRNRPGAIFSAGFNFNNLSLSYAVEIGLQKHSNIFNQVHEISLSYSFKKIKPTHVDTVEISKDTLLAEVIYQPSDSAIKISPNTNEYLYNQNNLALNTGYKVAEERKGEYIVIRMDEISNVQDINHNTDSNSVVQSNKTNNKIQNADDYEIIDVGNGLYSIKVKKQPGDSLNNQTIIYENIIDSIMPVDEILNRIKQKEEKNKYKADNQESYFYSIQLIINDSNKDILRDAEIAVNTWFDTDNDDNFVYYFGHYKTQEEAQKNLSKLEKYKSLKTRILKLQNLE